MKKLIIFAAIVSLAFTACGTYKSLDLNKLTTGMTKEQVKYTIGEPNRVLAVNDKKEGHQEVLEYRTSRDEVYALEFWNDYLTGYEFLYDDVTYVAPVAPPVLWPNYGRPIYILPSRPNKPNHPNRPIPPSRPEVNRPGMTKPSASLRPSARPSVSNEAGYNSSRPTVNRSQMTK